MSHINVLVMSGRLAADPELQTVGDNKTKTRFRLACTRKWGSAENQQETTWVDVECWAGLAGVVKEYCTKGQEVVCKGRLSIDKWEDREGNVRYSTRLVADDISFGSRPGRESSVDEGALAKLVDETLSLIENNVPKDVAIKAILEGN